MHSVYITHFSPCYTICHILQFSHFPFSPPPSSISTISNIRFSMLIDI